MPPKRTHEEFIRILSEVNPNVEVLGQYVNSATHIECKCKLDDYIWFPSPNKLLQGKGCPRCHKKEPYKESFMRRVSEIHPNIEICSPFIKGDQKVLCRCINDGYEWETTPYSLIKGSGCPRCSGKEPKTTNRFKELMSLVNPNIEIIGEYSGSNEQVLCKCQLDGCEWYGRPNHLLRGVGCPQCADSQGEKRIANYLSNRNIKYITQKTFDDCRDVRCLPFDFYLPCYDTAIEYDGKHHFEPVTFGGMSIHKAETAHSLCVKHDMLKSDYCKNNNIFLIRIPYTSFNEIDTILDKHFS